MKIPIKWFGGFEAYDRFLLLQELKGYIKFTYERKQYLLKRNWSSEKVYDFEFVDDIKGKGGIIMCAGKTGLELFPKIKETIATMPWVLMLCIGDEESRIRWETLKHNNIRFWVQFPRESITDERVTKFLWAGIPYGCNHYYKQIGKLDKKGWFFSGQSQIHHLQRHDCVKNLAEIKTEDDILSVNKEFLKGIYTREEYYTNLAKARFAPCPAGVQTADSFRLFEALECGTFPIADKRNFRNDTRYFNYWEYIFKTKDLPFPTLTEWSEYQSIMDKYKDDLVFLKATNRAWAWWINEKRLLVKDLHRDIKELSQSTYKNPHIKNQLTIIVSTSSIPSHPSTEIIEEVIDNLKSYEELKEVKIVIMIDEIREEFKGREMDYEKYINNLIRLCNFKWKNVLPIIFKEHLHQAVTTKVTLNKYVDTPFVMFVEHDTPLIGEIDFNHIFKAFDNPKVNSIRFHLMSMIHKDHEYLMEGLSVINEVPLMKTIQWSQRPHITRTSFYKEIMENFDDNSRTLIEDKIHGVVINESRKGKDFGMYIYHPEGSILRSGHSDGRKGESKFNMVF